MVHKKNCSKIYLHIGLESVKNSRAEMMPTPGRPLLVGLLKGLRIQLSDWFWQNNLLTLLKNLPIFAFVEFVEFDYFADFWHDLGLRSLPILRRSQLLERSTAKDNLNEYWIFESQMIQINQNWLPQGATRVSILVFLLAVFIGPCSEESPLRVRGKNNKDVSR